MQGSEHAVTDHAAGITVTQGQLVVNNVDVLYATPDVIILEADCRSKYPGTVTTGTSGRGVFADFWAGPGTLNVRDMDTPLPTTIQFPPRTQDWSIVATGARYTLRIVAWRHPGQRHRCIYRLPEG
jgi:hypothetical protein